MDEQGGSAIEGVVLVRETRRFDEMLAFYATVFDTDIVESWDRGPEDRGCVLALGDPPQAHVEILRLADLGPAEFEAVPHTSLSVEVSDVAAYLERVREGGMPIARGLEDTGWGHRSFGIDDPDGLRIWLYEDMQNR